MKRNYFYLIVGLLCVLSAVTHTLNGLETALPILSNYNIEDSAKTVFTYIWHIIGIENLVFGIVLIIMAFQKNMAKVKFTTWVIIVILLMRWVIITLFTVLNDKSNVVDLLPDTIVILTTVILLLLGIRIKNKN